ncbi:MAG TPA: protein TolQ [Bdellovibrionota bacterium]|nr:protein TolQ [Bdellovibrionota bacterium]
MNETHQNILSLVLDAGIIVKIILFFLLSLSVISWAVIIAKYLILKKSQKDNKRFLNLFWKEKDFKNIHNFTSEYPNSPLAKMFDAGFTEHLHFKTKSPPEENIIGALRKEAGMESARLEKGIAFLATIGNTSPFIGLFGTVWGIMNAFVGIGSTGTATLTTVAPGIAEALIATAMGLFVAIPAVIFYNHYTNKTYFISQQMDHFEIDFLNAMRR